MSYHLQIGLVLVAAAFAGGFFYGHAAGAKRDMRQAAAAFQMRKDMNHAVDKTGAVDLCIALGGVRESCRSALRGVGTAAKGE